MIYKYRGDSIIKVTLKKTILTVQITIIPMADKIFRIPDYAVSAPELLNKPPLLPGYCQALLTLYINIISCVPLDSDVPVIIYVLYNHTRQFINYLFCNG